MRDRLARALFDRGGLVALVATVAYLALAPAHVVDADNAELSALGATGGVPHPSGYPLYLLYLRLTAWLPGSTPAHIAALATALIAGAMVLTLHAAARAWGARPAAASVTCAIVAGAPVVMRVSTEAEVFALLGLLAAAILWLAGPGGPARGGRRAVALGLVAGLGLSNHLACVLLAPVGVWGAARGVREVDGRRRRAGTIALALAALVLGLAPYAYLCAAPSGGMSWGRIDSLTALLRHFLRADYGTGRLSAGGVDVPVAASLGALASTALRSWLYAPLAVGLGALALRVVRGPDRAAWGALAASIALAGPGLVSQFNIPPTPGVPLYVCQRLHLLSILLLSVPVAVGLTALGRALAGRRPGLAVRPAVASGAAIGVLLAAGGATLPELRRIHSPALERAMLATLEAAPPRAVILTQGDHYHFVGGYLQTARGVRPDVVMITGSMTPMRWYRDRTDARLGFVALPPAPGDADLRIAREVLAHGRPLLVDRNYGPIARAYASYPYGMLVRIVPPGEAPPTLDAVLAQNKQLFERIDLGYPSPRRDDNWPAMIHADYAETWRTLARALAGAKRTADAEWAGDLAAGLAPK